MRALTLFNLQAHSTLQRQRGIEEEDAEGGEDDEDEEEQGEEEEDEEEEEYESEKEGWRTGRQSYAVQYAAMRRGQK